MSASLRIIAVGQTIPGSRTPQRIRAMEELGHRVTMVPINRPGATYEDRPGLIERVRYRLRLPSDPAGADRTLAAAAEAGCDVVWVEAAQQIRAETLRQVRGLNPGVRLIWYSEDDMMNSVHRSRRLERAMPEFDLWVTTKSFNTAPNEVPSLGIRRMLFVDNSFDPHIHRPQVLTEAERRQWGADVSFVGTYENSRARSALHLAENGIRVRVWGNGWRHMRDVHPLLVVEDQPIYDMVYGRAVCASRINLAFLRKGNRDLQTCRTLEIPACGGFMAHEYTDEAARLFRPDHEAAFFRDDSELISLCRLWLTDEEARGKTAEAGRRRAWEGGHTHADRLTRILAAAFEDMA